MPDVSEGFTRLVNYSVRHRKRFGRMNSSLQCIDGCANLFCKAFSKGLWPVFLYFKQKFLRIFGKPEHIILNMSR